MAEVLKGAPVTGALCEKTMDRSQSLRARGISPTLAIVRVGERDDDIAYERSAMKRCGTMGVDATRIILPLSVTHTELLSEIEKLNRDASVHGVLLLRPLPKHLDEKLICEALSPQKDIDGITSASLAGVFTGSGAGFAPCTAQACMEILDYYGVDCTGKRVVVIGRSLVVGKPAAVMLIGKNATVTICHTKTRDLQKTVQGAEIVIAAAGKAGAVDGSFLAPGQIVVDVGINVSDDGRICGDVNFDEAEKIVAAITPVPGGVGGVTAAVLISHVVEAAERANQ